MAAADPCKELRLLLAYFGEARIPNCEVLAASETPEPFRRLLVHDDHMTVTLENYHGSRVAVRPYQIHRQSDLYGRKLDLWTENGEKIVMTGIMLFNLSLVEPQVREEIVQGQTPLGRILIEHGVLRRISSGTYLKFDPSDAFVKRFKAEADRPAYGRLATIFCDGVPAVDLLEIVNPYE